MPEIRSPEDSIFPRPGEGIKTTQMYFIQTTYVDTYLLILCTLLGRKVRLGLRSRGKPEARYFAPPFLVAFSGNHGQTVVSIRTEKNRQPSTSSCNIIRTVSMPQPPTPRRRRYLAIICTVMSYECSPKCTFLFIFDEFNVFDHDNCRRHK